MKFLRRTIRQFKRRRYEKWAVAFAKKWDLPYAGILMLAGYRRSK